MRKGKSWGYGKLITLNPAPIGGHKLAKRSESLRASAKSGRLEVSACDDHIIGEKNYQALGHTEPLQLVERQHTRYLVLSSWSKDEESGDRYGCEKTVSRVDSHSDNGQGTTA